MKLLKLIYRLFVGKTWIMLLGVLLTVLSFTSTLGLITLSSWFLASCFLFQSIDLNIFYPSSTIRGFAIARTFFKYLQRIITHKATFDVLTKLRVQVFASILPVAIDLEKFAALKQQTVKSRQEYAHNSNSGENPVLISDNELFDHLIRDIDHLDGFYVNILIPFLGCLLVFLGFTIGLCFISVPLALISGGALILVTLIVPWIFYPLGKKITGHIQQSTTLLRLAFLNYLDLQFENLIFNKEQTKEQNLSDLDQQLIKRQLQSDKYANLTTLIMQLLLGALVTFTLFGSMYLQIIHATNLYLPALAVVFTFFIVGAIELVIPLAALFLNLGQVVASANNLQNLLENKQANDIAQYMIDLESNKEPEIVDSTDLYPDLITPEFINTVDALELQVKHLNFNYQSNPIIEDLSFTFAPKTTYLISGDSGKGKTTFLNCLLGLETSYTGSITINGYNADGQQILEFEAKSGQHRQLCVHLSQRVHIFNDSLRENLLLANNSVTDEQIKHVLAQVELSHLSSDLNQILGNGGRSLSGGETRRIGIARVLLSNAKLIVLDEPTESIDSEIEKTVLNLIFTHAQEKGASVILVSHNKNNYNYCEHLYQMNTINHKTQLLDYTL